MYKPFENGRDYKFLIESDGTAVALTTKDIDATIDDGALKMPIGFRIMRIIPDISPLPPDEKTTISSAISLFPDGTMGVELPSEKCYSHATYYIWGYFER